MSYDFWLELPKAQHGPKRKGGLSAEQSLRLQRAREILLAHEPAVTFDDDETMFTANSAELGDVFVEPNRITLAFSLGADAFRIYSAIHGLMQRFHDEGYVAVDPQLGADVLHAESFPEFMRQYRSQFKGEDAEFAIWCTGRTPQAWIDREAAEQRGAACAADVLPRGFLLSWQEYRALPDAELWAHVKMVSERNDAAIAAHDLTAYMQAISERARSIYVHSSRRLNGQHYPIGSETPWWNGSLLHYEAIILGELRSRGFHAAAFDQPQELRVAFQAYGAGGYLQEREAPRTSLADRMRQLLKAAGLSESGECFGSEGRWEYSFFGSDADAMYAAVSTLLEGQAATGLFAVTRRYGDLGAREVEVQIPGRE